MLQNHTQNSYVGIQSFLQQLDLAPDKPLIFHLAGKSINPGYHVTEIKHAAINSLDCGQGAEKWDEVIVQLLNGTETSVRGHMSGQKFLQIVQSATQALPIENDPRLYFEYSTENQALNRLVVDSVDSTSDNTLIKLTGEHPRCKAFERALQPQAVASSCCAPDNPTDRSSSTTQSEKSGVPDTGNNKPRKCC